MSTPEDSFPSDSLTRVAMSFVPAQGHYADTLRLGVYHLPQNPFPYPAAARNQLYTDLIFSSLARRAPNGSLSADLAASWKLDSSATLWSITLRPQLLWSDSTPLRSSDVAYSLELALKELPGNLFDTLSPTIASVDSFTVSIAFARSFCHEEVLLCAPIVPRGAVAGTVTHKVSGPFLPAKNTRTQRLILARNPYYHALDPSGKNLPYLDAVVLILVNSVNQAHQAFCEGTIDLLISSDPDRLALGTLFTETDFVQHDLRARQALLLVFNPASGSGLAPLFVQQRFRQALASAIDYATLATLAGAQRSSVLFPGSNQALAAPLFQPEKSRLQLDSLGFVAPDSTANRQYPAGSDATINLWVAEEILLRKQIATHVSTNWQQIGIHTQVTPAAAADLLQMASDSGSAWDCLLISVDCGPGVLGCALFYAEAIGTLSEWFGRQAGVKDFIDQALWSPNRELASHGLKQLVGAALKDYPAIALPAPHREVILSSRIANVNPAPMLDVLHNIDELFVVQQ